MNMYIRNVSISILYSQYDGIQTKKFARLFRPPPLRRGHVDEFKHKHAVVFYRRVGTRIQLGCEVLVDIDIQRHNDVYFTLVRGPCVQAVVFFSLSFWFLHFILLERTARTASVCVCVWRQRLRECERMRFPRKTRLKRNDGNGDHSNRKCSCAY